MTGLNALQSVQFVSKKGKRFAVLALEDWETLIEWLETVEDAQIARQAFGDLAGRTTAAKREGGTAADAVSWRRAEPACAISAG